MDEGKPTPPEIDLGGVTVDLARHVVTAGGEARGLTPLEVRLLAYLAARPGVAVSREELLDRVWGWRPDLDTRAVFHAVVRLRKKIEADPGEPRWLRAVYGVGYVLDLPSRRPRSAAGLPGREPDLARLDALDAAGARLVTITGPAGVGKSALAACWSAGRSGALVDLAGVPPDGLSAALAAALAPDRCSDEGLARALGSTPILVLDDVEPLGSAWARPLGRALARAPRTSLVVTSREPLGLPGERTVRLNPLAVPEQGLEDDAVRASGAVALLDAVASRVRGGAGLAREELHDGARLVRALEGLPLAIVLAGARLRAASAGEVRESLEGSGTDRTPLRRVLERTWERLGPEEREALARCAPLRGAFRLADAEAVVGARAGAALEVLVARSLVVARPGVPMGYRVLRPIRDFAEASAQAPRLGGRLAGARSAG